MSYQLSNIVFDYSIPKELTPHSGRKEQYIATVRYEVMTGTPVYEIKSVSFDPFALIHLAHPMELFNQINNCVRSKVAAELEETENA